MGTISYVCSLVTEFIYTTDLFCYKVSLIVYNFTHPSVGGTE